MSGGTAGDNGINQREVHGRPMPRWMLETDGRAGPSRQFLADHRDKDDRWPEAGTRETGRTRKRRSLSRETSSEGRENSSGFSVAHDSLVILRPVPTFTRSFLSGLPLGCLHSLSRWASIKGTGRRPRTELITISIEGDCGLRRLEGVRDC